MVPVVLSLMLLQAVAQATPPVKPVAPLPAARILVVPFDTPAGDARTYWLGEGVSVLIGDDLDARGVGAITRSARERAYDQLHLPPNAVLSRATVIKVGQLVGATQVIVGDVSVDGTALTVRAQSIRIDVGRAAPEVTERGALPDLLAVVQRVSNRIVPGGATDLPTSTTLSLQAFEQAVKGLLAEKPASQAEFLERALAIDPGYDRARLALWEVRTNQGDHAAALAAVRTMTGTSPRARRGRFLAGVSEIALKQYDEAFATFKALLDEFPDPAVLNNLGVVQLRRGTTPETGKPAYYFTKAADAEPDDPDFLFNLGYAYAVDRDPQAALYWLREALRRNPADGDAHFVLAAELDASGSSVEAGRERELAGQLSATYAERHSEMLPKGLERVRPDLESRRNSGVDQALVSTAQRDSSDLAQFHLDRGRRLYERERDREAMAELRRAVFLSPYEAEAHLLIGRIHLRAGRPKEAVDALKISIWSRDSVAARIALAEAYLRLKDTPSARAQAEKALALDPASTEAKQLLEKIERGPGHW